MKIQPSCSLYPERNYLKLQAKIGGEHPIRSLPREIAFYKGNPDDRPQRENIIGGKKEERVRRIPEQVHRRLVFPQ